MKFDDLKRVDLVAFCINKLGYEIVKGKDTRRNWRVLKSRNGTKILTKNSPNSNGHIVYRNMSNSHESGTLIDLLLKVEGLDYSQIRDMYCGGGDDYEPVPLPPRNEGEEDIDVDNTAFIKSLMEEMPSPENSLLNNYLNKRGISTETMKHFSVGATSSFYTPLWRLVDGSWRAQTLCKYFYDYSGKSRQLFQKGLQKKGAVSILKQKGMPFEKYKKAIIFESPIDALSYFELFRSNCIYMSSCGALSNAQIANIPFLLSAIGVEDVVLAFDNDEAGDQFTAKLSPSLWREGCDLTVEVSQKKDWNDDLCDKK
jgi:hypothetical protein